MEIAKLFLEFLKIFIWPVTTLILVFIFRNELSALIGRIKTANLPGGVSVDFDQELKNAKKLSEKVEKVRPPKGKGKLSTLPLNEVNAKLISQNLQPSSSGLDFNKYRNLAYEDPNLALAGLRIELEAMSKNVARGFKVDFDEKDSAGILLNKLRASGAITENQAQLAAKVLKLCNAALHGKLITKEEADSIIDISEILADQFIKWLSWGFKHE